MGAKRFDETTQARPHYLWNFVDRVLVECPKCNACAVVSCDNNPHGTPRLSCSACGTSRRGWPAPPEATLRAYAHRRCSRCNDWLGKAPVRFRARGRMVEVRCECGALSSNKLPRGSMVLGATVDPYFRFPLWLRADVRGQTLWAYNRDHLALLEAYVRAELRARTPNWNASLVSRLPRWLKAAEARASVLRALARLARR